MSASSKRPLIERVPRSLVHLFIVLAVTNFLYLHEFQAILRSVDFSTSYYRAQAFYWPAAGAFFGSLAIVILVVFAIVEIAFRRGWLSEANFFRLTAAFVLYRLLTMLPLFLSSITPVDLSYLQESYAAVAVGAILVALFISLAPRLSAKIGKPAALLVTALFIFQLLTFAWRAAHLPSSARFADGLTLPARAEQNPKLHIVWIVFDELDYELSSDLGPNSVKMPEFDRLRTESLSLTDAHSPAAITSISFPALLTGRQVDDATPQGPDDLYLAVNSPKGKQRLLWRTQPTMFSYARDHGLNAAIIGWHHPYCRMFNSSLVDCFWTPNVDVLNSLRLEFIVRRRGLLFLLPGWWGMSETQQYEVVAREQQLEYKETHEHALKIVTNRNVNLMLLHWLVPHPPGIYDRNRDTFAVSGADYFDNLELVDKTLAELRQKLESAGLWDDTAFMVTGDHPLRENLWKDRPTWTHEEAALCAKRKNPRVPLLIKLPRQHGSATYTAPVNTVLIYDLLIHWMQGKDHTVEKVRAFLDQNRARFPIIRGTAH